MLVALFLVLSVDFKLSVDEISAAAIVSSFVQGSRVAMLTVRGGQSRPYVDLYIVDGDTGKARIIEDGRMNITVKSRVFGNGKGFVILERAGKMLYEVTGNGDFVSSYRLEQLSEFSGSTVIVAQTYIDKENIALTYMDLEEKGRLFLAKFNIVKKSLEILNTAEKESGFWEFHKNEWYFVDDKTGQITRLGKTFQGSNEVRRALARFKIPLPPEVQKLLAAQGVSSDANLLEGYFLNDRKLKYWCCTYPEGWPENKQKYTQLCLNEGKVSYENSPALTVASTKAGILQFNMDTSEFSLFPVAKSSDANTKH